MSDELETVLPKIAPLLRRLTSSADNEVISAAHLLLRVLAGAGLDIHALVERIEHGGSQQLSARAMQQIYDTAYAKGHADGAEQSRRGAVIAAAMPMGMLDTTDVGPGVNGYTWIEIAHYCADNKHRISRDRDREFIDSVFEQLASGRRAISPPQAKWLRDIFKHDLPEGSTDAADP
jgi:hypothetical protein